MNRRNDIPEVLHRVGAALPYLTLKGTACPTVQGNPRGASWPVASSDGLARLPVLRGALNAERVGPVRLIGAKRSVVDQVWGLAGRPGGPVGNRSGHGACRFVFVSRRLKNRRDELLLLNFLQ